MASIPTIITFAGLLSGSVGAILYPGKYGLVLLGISLILDIVDGWAARRLEATSEFGAALDMTGDSLLAVMIAYAAGGPCVAAVVVVGSAVLTSLSTCGRLPHRSSGRAVVTLWAFAHA